MGLPYVVGPEFQVEVVVEGVQDRVYEAVDLGDTFVVAGGEGGENDVAVAAGG